MIIINNKSKLGTGILAMIKKNTVDARTFKLGRLKENQKEGKK